MGWIRRNRFWYEHHDLYVEPTEEQKELSRLSKLEYERSDRELNQMLGYLEMKCPGAFERTRQMMRGVR